MRTLSSSLIFTSAKISGITVVHARDEMPEVVNRSVFLAGPISRDGEKCWRDEAICALIDAGFQGVFYNPVTDDYDGFYNEQVSWELQMLNAADCILFWVPREMKKMPALTTNVEFGSFYKSGKVVLGFPKEAESMDYLSTLYEQEYGKKPCMTLKSAVECVVEMTKDASNRKGGERKIPLYRT